MKRVQIIAALVTTVIILGCAKPPTPVPDRREPTDRVLTLRVTTNPEPELIEPIITANYGPDQVFLPADDLTPLDGYIPDPPIVTPWGWEFRLALTTPGPLRASVRIKVRRLTKVTCKWYVGQGSNDAVWTDISHGETVCLFQIP